MRNLRKVLALVLTLAMMLSVMVMNTGAAFTDQKDVNEKHTEAVDMCVALSILNGYTDGSFQPNGSVTRAEMCKMVCVAMNGGKVPSLGTAAVSSFKDVATSNWASPFIEACVAQGIVAGVGNGQFDPDGKVTGTQAAKMMLIALGYDADAEGLVGNGWDVKTNVLATKTGLYEDLEDIDVSAALSREHAAQMLWNCLQADEVEYDSVLTVDANGNLVSTLKAKVQTGKDALSDWYGTLTTNDTGVLTAISYSTKNEEWTYTLTAMKDDGTLDNTKTYSFISDVDYTDLLGHNVHFVAEAKDDVYGAYADDSVVAVSGLLGDIDTADVTVTPAGTFGGSFEVDDTDYDVSAKIVVELFTAANNATVGVNVPDLRTFDAMIDVFPYFEYTAIDWDDDDDVDSVIVYPVLFGEINYVGSDYVRIPDASGFAAAVLAVSGASIFETGNANKYGTDADDNEYIVYDGAAKEDYAVVSYDTTLVNDGIIELLAKETGKVTSYSKDTAVIDGTNYDLASAAASNVTGNLNKDIDFRVINDYVVWASNASELDLSDYVLVTGITSGTASNGYYTADLLFTDGTQVTAPIKSLDDGTDLWSKDALVATQAYMGLGAIVQNAVNSNTNLYTYEVSSGKYELTWVNQGGLPVGTNDFDAANLPTGTVWEPAGSASKANATINLKDGVAGKAKIDSSAIIYLLDGEDYSVVTGADLAKVTKTVDVFYAGGEENDNGYVYVTFAYVKTSAIAAGDEVYGFVTSDVSVKEDSDGTYYSFTAWNGEEYVDLTTLDVTSSDFTGTSANLGTQAQVGAGTAPLSKQAIICYRVDADGAVTDLEVLAMTDYAITGWDKTTDGYDLKVTDTSATATSISTDDEDTTILWIDRSEKTGDATGSFTKADKYDVPVGGNTYAGVYFVNAAYNATEDLLVVDVSNDWYDYQ